MYNPVLKLVHRIFIFFKIDSITAKYFNSSIIGRWIIPSHTLYNKNSNRNLPKQKFILIRLNKYGLIWNGKHVNKVT
jgi:hypothetical protein